MKNNNYDIQMRLFLELFLNAVYNIQNKNATSDFHIIVSKRTLRFNDNICGECISCIDVGIQRSYLKTTKSVQVSFESLNDKAWTKYKICDEIIEIYNLNLLSNNTEIYKIKSEEEYFMTNLYEQNMIKYDSIMEVINNFFDFNELNINIHMMVKNSERINDFIGYIGYIDTIIKNICEKYTRLKNE